MLSDRLLAAVERGDVDAAAGLFSEAATFRSPVLFEPYQGRDRVLQVLQAAKPVLGLGGGVPARAPARGSAGPGRHQLEDPQDRVAILEFATTVDGKQVEGIDKLTFDETARSQSSK